MTDLEHRGEPAVKQIRVLVVDDEEELVSSIIKCLGIRGLSAEGVSSGERALDILQSKDFDVVILDFKMPGMNGVDVLRQIKKKSPAAEVIMYTGNGPMETGIDALQLGAYQWIRKPITVNELLVQINNAYDRKLIEADRRVQDEPL